MEKEICFLYQYRTLDMVSKTLAKAWDCNTAVQLLFSLYQAGQLYYAVNEPSAFFIYSHPELTDEKTVHAEGVDFLLIALIKLLKLSALWGLRL